MTDRFDAVVVGSGPNGLAAAVTLARAGRSVLVLERASEIGGGTRTAELTVPGLKHDLCSAVHPFGVASPFLAALPLHEHGLRWMWPEIDAAHPLDDGTAAVLWRSIAATADGLGVDGTRWRSVFGPLTERIEDLTTDALGPLVRIPSHPVAMAKLAVRAGLPASALLRFFRTERARALFAGAAVHVWRPFGELATASVGTLMIAAGHRYGWPVARGGSAAISRALAGLLTSLGGQIVTCTTVASLGDLPPARVTVFDTGPAAFADVVGDIVPHRRAHAYRRYRYGPAAYKVDLAVRDSIPCAAHECRRAGTVHVGGMSAEIADTEQQLNRGLMSGHPFVLVGQQYLADPARSVGDIHPVYMYAHVPHGYTGSATEAMGRQIERFAPGFTERVISSHVTTPAGFAAENPNYVGGDIVGGLCSARQLFGRPTLLHSYDTGVPGMFLCSASTPPGAGTHGMCGYHAANRALAYLERNQSTPPALSGRGRLPNPGES